MKLKYWLRWWGRRRKHYKLRLLSFLSLIFQIRIYRPGIRQFMLLTRGNKKNAHFPYVIFIRNRFTGNFHICFAEHKVRTRFSKVYLAGCLISNLETTTHICLGDQLVIKRWWSPKRFSRYDYITRRFSLKGGIDRFWWSPFSKVNFHPSDLDESISRMKMSTCVPLWKFLLLSLGIDPDFLAINRRTYTEYASQDREEREVWRQDQDEYLIRKSRYE